MSVSQIVSPQIGKNGPRTTPEGLRRTSSLTIVNSNRCQNGSPLTLALHIPAGRPRPPNLTEHLPTKKRLCLCEVRSSDPRLQHQTCNYLFIEAQHLQAALKSVMMDYLLFSNYRISHKNESFKANVYYLVWNDLSVPFSGFWAPFVPVSRWRNVCAGQPQHVSMWTC